MNKVTQGLEKFRRSHLGLDWRKGDDWIFSKFFSTMGKKFFFADLQVSGNSKTPIYFFSNFRKNSKSYINILKKHIFKQKLEIP